MKSLEVQLRPSGPESLARDLFVAGLLLGLAFLLIPAWERTLPPPLADHGDTDSSMQANDDPRTSSYRQDVIGQLASVTLLGALGFLLAMRQGAIDLSIWAVMGAGGLIAAAVINAGASPWTGFLAAAGFGAVVGGFNALFVGGIRLPSLLVTPLVGMGIILAVPWFVDGREIVVRADAFDNWLLAVSAMLHDDQPAAPLLTARMVLVAAGWSVVLVVLLVRYHLTLSTDDDPERRRPALLAALVASGALAGLAGACWILDHGRAPVPTRPVDGLLIPTAAILAGGALLVGRGRTILACICLPVAVLMVKLWRLVAPPFRTNGFNAAVIILAVMVFGVQLAVVWAISRRRYSRNILPIISTGIMTLGLAVSAAALRWSIQWAWRGLLIGLVIWGAGLILTGVTVAWALHQRRQAKADVPAA